MRECLFPGQGAMKRLCVYAAILCAGLLPNARRPVRELGARPRHLRPPPDRRRSIHQQRQLDVGLALHEITFACAVSCGTMSHPTC